METEQQQLFERNTYTPSGASQACRPVVLSLNREETLSEQDSKTSDNNLDVNPQSSKTEQNLRVFVLNMQKKPLMPCKPAKARHLLKEGKARVVSTKPFTIQLTTATGEVKQDVNLGVDAGYKYIGFSATTSKSELICGELELRTNVSKKISNKKMYRVNRRGKLWYRKPRFLNRVRSKPKGWIAPSVQHKVDSHIRLIEKIKSILPITKTIIEVAKFDTQKLQNTDIEGVEYQYGRMEGYDNLRAFVFQRDKYTCQICKKKNGILQTHHIIQRKDEGSNRPDNLSTVHKTCHDKFHAGKIKHVFKKPKSFKETVVINNIRKYVVDKLDCDYTYGYITKRNRIEQGLEKTHCNDAFVISKGKDQERTKLFMIKQVGRNNRCLQRNRKGYKPSIRRQRYNYQPNDIVKYNNVFYVTKGCHNKGLRIIININDNNKSVNIKNVKLIKYGKGMFN